MTKYIECERARHWLVSKKLMAKYRDGSHTAKDWDGDLIWKQNNLLHRDGDKPAFIGRDGRLEWLKNGLRHRDGDKPAYISADGTLIWWQNDQIHRFSGPAVIRPDGKLEWWINNKTITEEVNEWLGRKRWRGTPEQIFEFQLRFT